MGWGRAGRLFSSGGNFVSSVWAVTAAGKATSVEGNESFWPLHSTAVHSWCPQGLEQTFLQSTEYLTLSSGMLCDSRVSDVTKFFLTMKTCLLPFALDVLSDDLFLPYLLRSFLTIT